MRDWCAEELRKSLTAHGDNTCQRLSIVDIDMHYEPMRNTSKYASSSGMHLGTESTVWKAVVIQPSSAVRIKVDLPVSIPQLVWEAAVVRRKRTLQTAAYTMESTRAIIDYINGQRARYGMD